MELARAKRAAAFMEEGGVFHEAWAELETRIMHEWRHTPPAATERREELHRLLQAMNGLENILQGFVQGGAMALERISQEERERATGA